jgi:tetratricopeptide (TPR) repeat protein
MVAQARTWAAGCAITIGRQELDSRRLETATKWFARAILLDTDTGVARTARIAMGDALAGQGDFAASLDAYQRARDGLSEADTLYTILDRKINSVFDARRTFR